MDCFPVVTSFITRWSCEAEMASHTINPPLDRLPWFVELVDYLKTHEDDLWQWFATEADREKQAAAVRLDLLRTTYRIERDSQPTLYETADAVSTTLGINAPLTIYQAQQAPELNASLKYVPGEVHVVLHGPLLETLDDRELRALLGHEISHYLLWTGWDEEVLIAHEILLGMLNDPRGDEVHLETYRRMRLFSEVFCDRGSHIACGDLETAVRALIKMQTGLKNVDAKSYLRQAEEASQGADVEQETRGEFVTEGFSHPEAFLRVRALQLWSTSHPASEVGNLTESAANSASFDTIATSDAVEKSIRRMIEGPLSLQQIDLPAQCYLTSVTREVIRQILEPAWIRTESVMSHARLFFPDINAAREPTDVKQLADAHHDIAAMISRGDETIAGYVSSLLLDFVTSDRDIQDAALAVAMQLADAWGIGESFSESAIKELKLRRKQYQQIWSDAESLIARASVENHLPR